MNAKKWFGIVSIMMIVSLILSACQQKVVETVTVKEIVTQIVEKEATPQVIEKEVVKTEIVEKEKIVEQTKVVEVEKEVMVTPTPSQITRKGGWLDTIVIVEEPTGESGVSRIQAGELDAHVYGWDDPSLFETVKADPNLSYVTNVGSSDEITFNPAGPVFTGTGKLNPFAVAKIREAVNWMLDRSYITEEIMGGLGIVRFFPIVSGFPDYARYIDKVRELETYYAYNPEKGKTVITEEMQKLGATLVDGKWQYNNEPVEIIFLIRTEDERKEIGDYLSNQLESIGFTVKRDYRTATEAAPLWRQGDPNNGEWHLYTGGWITTQVVRDQGGNFEYYHTNRGMASPLWQNYVVSPEYDEICTKLSNNLFDTLEERDQLYRRALELSMQEGARTWVADGLSFSPFKPGINVVADLSGGIQGADLWALTMRWGEQPGGAMTIANASILTENWNPIAGTNQVYDQMIMKGVGDQAVIADPYTGLYWPQRIERAELYAVEGLPITSSYDWMKLKFVPEIVVPEDAWIDWDAAAQRFIPASEYFTETVTARTKMVVYYPANLYDIQWHDGSKFSLADILMAWILNWDTGKEASPLYDAAQVPSLESFQSHFKGIRVVQENPLIVEWYDDAFQLDAETTVNNWGTFFFPFYNYGQGAWHTLGVDILAETNGELAFSSDKANLLEVEAINMIGGPSLAILEKYMNQAADEVYIPYSSFLSQYITPEEAAARWANLKTWYERHGHFWVGTGPYYMDKVFTVEGTVLLKNNPNFLDTADKWLGFGKAKTAEVALEGPNSVKIGEEASFDVKVTYEGAAYPASEISQVKYLVFGNEGNLAFSGEAQLVEEGLYKIVFTKEQSALLKVGSNKMEIAVVSLKVSIPSMESIEFISE
jgi:peptide/nickel transport system substrate-binding protein